MHDPRLTIHLPGILPAHLAKMIGCHPTTAQKILTNSGNFSTQALARLLDAYGDGTAESWQRIMGLTDANPGGALTATPTAVANAALPPWLPRTPDPAPAADAIGNAADWHRYRAAIAAGDIPRAAVIRAQIELPADTSAKRTARYVDALMAILTTYGNVGPTSAYVVAKGSKGNIVGKRAKEGKGSNVTES